MSVSTSTSQNQVTVLYIVGEGRSGSTIIDNLLNSLPNVTSLGELHFLYERGIQGNQVCGCGSEFKDCEFWSNVLRTMREKYRWQEVLGFFEQLGFDSLLRFPIEALRDHFGTDGGLYESSVAVFDEIYRAAAAISNASLIVDSSKTIHFAYFLQRYSDLDIRFLHLVRDARGVAYSRRKSRVRHEIVGEQVMMPKVSPWRSSLKWVVNNLGAEKVIGDKPYLCLRYEDFAQHPVESLNRVIEFADYRGTIDANFFEGDQMVSENHSVSGNPSRLLRTSGRVSLDEKWRADLRANDRRLVTLLTYPLLRRYNYT